MSSEPRYYTQTAGSKINYTMDRSGSNVQVTIGGRETGSVTIKYRPDLGGHPVLKTISIDAYSDTQFETPTDNVIPLDPQGNGTRKRTFTLSNIRLSAIQIDDSGNAGNALWVQIQQWD